jgi:hypothetical protein
MNQAHDLARCGLTHGTCGQFLKNRPGLVDAAAHGIHATEKSADHEIALRDFIGPLKRRCRAGPISKLFVRQSEHPVRQPELRIDIQCAISASTASAYRRARKNM